jgi:branched-chain amino acid transport system ATP-binding protein
MTVRENVQMALISHHRRTLDLFSRASQALPRRSRPAAGDGIHAATTRNAPVPNSPMAISSGSSWPSRWPMSPDLLLMDEPTAGMAPSERTALMQLTDSIVANGKVSVLFTEHDMDVVFAHAHRILVLNRGEIIAEGSSERHQRPIRW